MRFVADALFDFVALYKVLSYGVITLTVTETDTENKYTEPSGNLSSVSLLYEQLYTILYNPFLTVSVSATVSLITPLQLNY